MRRSKPWRQRRNRSGWRRAAPPLAFVAVLAAVLGVLPSGGRAADAPETSDRSSRPPRALRASVKTARPTAVAQQWEAKLEQVIQNDQQILARFDAIMAELQVVKIRATRRPVIP